MEKPPDWAMKSRTALNTDKFILFDMFGSPCSRVEILSKFTGTLNVVLWHTCVQLIQSIWVAHISVRLPGQTKKSTRIKTVIDWKSYISCYLLEAASFWGVKVEKNQQQQNIVPLDPVFM